MEKKRILETEDGRSYGPVVKPNTEWMVLWQRAFWYVWRKTKLVPSLYCY